ncbi:MAG: IPT/TIG domain-containing protein [Blastocatellia bacterium]
MQRNRRPLMFILFVLFVALASVCWNAAQADSSNSIKRAQTPTFNREVVRIFRKSCQTCHHPGDIAPFSLVTYKEARPWAQAIREEVALRQMPPWKPAPGCSDLRDVRALSQDEINTIVAWVDGGAPEGNAADLPAPLEFSDGWPQGEPDLVVAPDVSYTPPARRGDDYRCFSIPTAARGDRFIRAVDVQPGNRKIVHHVVAYADPRGVSARLDGQEAGPGYTCFGGPGFDTSDILGTWVPGQRGFFTADGTGIKLPNNSRVVVQVHYSPGSEPEPDRTSMGFYFAKAPVTKQLNFLAVLNTTFTIPAGAKRHEVTGEFTLPNSASMHLTSVTPHMHLLGREIKLEMTRPGGPAQCLINIPDWDFNWQGDYLFKDPVAAPGGTRLRMTSIFDNSADNPRNPNNPPKPVRWGEATTDEMAVALVSFTFDGQTLPLSSPQLADVTVDQNNNLVVAGAGFLPGADIEINGRSLQDTRAESVATKLSSSELWRVLAAPGQAVNVTVINPDGVRTEAKSFTRAGTALATTPVSAASYARGAIAPDSIVAAFGTNLATGLAVAQTVPLPTSLNGTSVRVNGVLAPLFFVSSQQVNFLAPATTAFGNAVIEITSGDNTLSRGSFVVAATAPGLFTSNAGGSGAPAAVATADGVNFKPVGNADGTPNPLDAGDYLALFGTGFRRAAKETVTITIGGKNAPVLFAGAQGGLAGLDQINTQLPPGISGVVDLVVTVNGRTANVVRVRIK